MATDMTVDECHGCRHYKRIDRASRLCRACMGRADRDLRLRLYAHTDHGASTRSSPVPAGRPPNNPATTPKTSNAP